MPIECDVAIVGCGPTGVVLANLLGLLGVRVVALERDREVYSVPRATHIDEETLRNFQATGLIDELLAHTTPFGRIDVIDHERRVLLTDRVGDEKSVHGYTGSRFFDQPAFERILRDGLSRFPNVRLHTGVDVVELDDTGDGVTVLARGVDADAPLTVRASWIVGCDGGRSVVRQRLGVEMEPIAPKAPWLIVDTLLRDDADAALLPDAFQYVLAPERLTVYAHGIGRNRRWEFRLADDGSVPATEEVIGWVSAFVDPARLEVTRIVPYDHTALLATKWRVGRVLLAGDAAHMMPPSAGQGMCSGIRDAVNLAWKLESVLSGHARTELLDSYEQERRPHVREILEGTIFIGRRLEARTPFERWLRRERLRLVGAVPWLKELLRARGLRRPNLRDGFLDTGRRLVGQPFPQVTVRRNDEDRLVDDVFGYGFALVAAPSAIDATDAAWAEVRRVRLWRPGVELDGRDGRIGRWLADEGLDFAIVRPDRYLFAAGRVGDLTRARAAFDRWFV